MYYNTKIRLKYSKIYEKYLLFCNVFSKLEAHQFLAFGVTQGVTNNYLSVRMSCISVCYYFLFFVNGSIDSPFLYQSINLVTYTFKLWTIVCNSYIMWHKFMGKRDNWLNLKSSHEANTAFLSKGHLFKVESIMLN